MKARFDRQEYLALEEIFEVGQLDDVTKELCEFSDDIEDMAYELAYTRYALAKCEARHNALWNFYEQLENAMYEFEKEARIERMKRVAAERFRESYKEIAANAVKQNDALREAVAWVKECELVRHYVIFEALETCALREITSSISSARAEVDRLLGGE